MIGIASESIKLSRPRRQVQCQWHGGRREAAITEARVEFREVGISGEEGGMVMVGGYQGVGGV